MKETSAAAGALHRLLIESEAEREAIAVHLGDLRRLDSDLRTGAASREQRALAAVALHGYYTALEAFFERVALAIDESLPSGESWHRALLTQMGAPWPRSRPAVLSTELRDELDELRRFRHFFRHAYAVRLDAARLAEHSARVLRVHQAVVSSLDRFLGFVEATRDELLDAGS